MAQAPASINRRVTYLTELGSTWNETVALMRTYIGCGRELMGGENWP